MQGYKITQAELLELEKCADNPIYFIESYCKIIHLDHGLIPFKLFSKQRQMVLNMKNNRFNIVMASRQFGKTSAVAGFMCWLAIFNENHNICILADQETHAIRIIDDIKLMFAHLPLFLKPVDENGNFLEDNKKSIVLTNGARIFGAATTPKSIRGESISFLFLDEFSMIDDNMAEAFMNNALPTISSGKTSQITITSTPKGMNHFWSLWQKAEKGKNSYVPLRIDWWDRPDRDEKWKKEMIKMMNGDEIRFSQEFENKFLGGSYTLVDHRILESLCAEEPIDIRLNDFLKIYKMPDRAGLYVMGVDVARVVNKDYHAVQILRVDVMPFQQVAVFHTKSLSYRNYDDYLARIGELYNNAYILIERNDIGQTIADSLWFNYNYTNVIWDPFANKSEPGILTTSKTKLMYIQLIKDYLDQRLVEIYDEATIQELSHFVLQSNSAKYSKYGPDSDIYHDDLVMSMGLALFYVLTPFYIEITEEQKDAQSLLIYKELKDLLSPGIFVNRNHKSLEEIKEEMMKLKPKNGLKYFNTENGEIEEADNFRNYFAKQNFETALDKRNKNNYIGINTQKGKDLW